MVYQIGTLITTGAFGSGFIGRLIAVITFIGIIAALIIKNRKVMNKEHKLI